mmetsp:Transcript_81468/g.189205  ORF Transcript_81468/g.189205 Transcript_81468/m.189205 type:complete len:238 (-) Transcript_81468:54-767(-)
MQPCDARQELVHMDNMLRRSKGAACASATHRSLTIASITRHARGVGEVDGALAEACLRGCNEQAAHNAAVLGHCGVKSGLCQTLGCQFLPDAEQFHAIALQGGMLGDTQQGQHCLLQQFRGHRITHAALPRSRAPGACAKGNAVRDEVSFGDGHGLGDVDLSALLRRQGRAGRRGGGNRRRQGRGGDLTTDSSSRCGLLLHNLGLQLILHRERKASHHVAVNEDSAWGAFLWGHVGR